MVWAWVAAVVATALAWQLDRLRRRYADLPTTPAAAVFAGRNEVVGRAWTARPTSTHRTGAAAVWWCYTLEEERQHTRTVTSTDSKGHTTSRTETYRQWHEIDRRQGSVDEIEVVDPSGSALVRLDGAKVISHQVFSDTFDKEREGSFLTRIFDNATGRYRETEHGVLVGDQLFVVGVATLDETRLVPVLAEDVMVSTRTEASHRSWLGAGAGAALLLAIGATTVAIALTISPDDPSDPTAWLPGVAVVALGLTAAWLATTYNRLKLVAQGADRAWSLVDVQLRRRHDLIPALAEVVRRHASYESDVLVAATSSREVTDAGRQTTELRHLVAAAEAVPELTADEAFLSLQRELADTEDRIAATRSFHNDSLTLLAERRQAFPSSLVARRVPVAHRDLVQTEGFERTVPSVRREFDDAPRTG